MNSKKIRLEVLIKHNKSSFKKTRLKALNVKKRLKFLSTHIQVMNTKSFSIPRKKKSDPIGIGSKNTLVWVLK